MEVKYLRDGKLVVIETIYGSVLLQSSSWTAQSDQMPCSHVGGGGSGCKADNDFIDKEVAAFLAI